MGAGKKKRGGSVKTVETKKQETTITQGSDGDMVIKIGAGKSETTEDEEEDEDENKRHAQTSDFDNDGVNLVGRFGIFFGTLALLLFLYALVAPTWSIVKNVGSGDLLINQNHIISSMGEASFGLWYFCFEVPTDHIIDGSSTADNFIASNQSLCFTYDDHFFLRGYNPNATSAGGAAVFPTEPQTACHYLDSTEICDKRQFILYWAIGTIFFLIVADIYSEKLLINALGCTFGAVGAGGMIGLWYEVHLKFTDETAGGVDFGMGYMCLVCALVCCLLGATLSIIDLSCYDTERFGCMNDGTQVIGRLGALFGCLVWVFFLVCMVDPNWAKTSDLGSLETNDGKGNYVDVGLGAVDHASWGIWRYCLELPTDSIVLERVPGFSAIEYSNALDADKSVSWKNYFEQSKQNFCFWTMQSIRLSNYTTLEAGTGIPEKQTGCDLFTDVNYCQGTKWIFLALLGSVTIAFIDDIYSEKLPLNASIMALCTIGGGYSCVTWLIFVFHISGPKSYGAAAEVEPAYAWTICLIATGMSLVATILNLLDWNDICELPCEKGDKLADNSGGCFFCYGSGTSGYNNKNDAKDDDSDDESPA